MVKEVVMPRLGAIMKLGVVSAWFKREGDPIRKGEVIASIHSEKIEMDLEAPVGGEILKIAVNEYREVPPGTVICYIEENIVINDEITQSETNIMDIKDSSDEDRGSFHTSPLIIDASAKISPVARKMAEEAGIVINTLKGTGPGGRIMKDDVEKALENGLDIDLSNQEETTESNSPCCDSVHPDIPPTKELINLSEYETESLIDETNNEITSIDQSIFEYDIDFLNSLPEIEYELPVYENDDEISTDMPIYEDQSYLYEPEIPNGQPRIKLTPFQPTLFIKVDVTELKSLQHQLSPSQQNLFDENLTMLDFITKAVVLSLQRHKRMNSVMIDNEIHMNKHVHLGIGFTLENKWIVPVIPNAEIGSLKTLSKSIKNLFTRAHNHEIRNSELVGATFSVINLDSSGVEYFTPILDKTESGVLGLGTVKDEPIFIGDELKRRSILPLSLTFDHRVLDSDSAAAFLHYVKEYIEQPLSLLL